MEFSIQPTLTNDLVNILPLHASDFERLYKVASDPKVWEQHPNKNRYKREVFENFFKGALESGGAFLIENKESNEVLGSTRFYDYDPDLNLILIGYTFYGAKFWGKNFNHSVKKSMLDYIFQFVEKVQFHVGALNIRSQVSITRLGAVKIDEINVAYYGEAPATNFVYEISKLHWNT